MSTQYHITAPERLPAGLSIALPASKSLSNRALVMQALSGAAAGLSNLSDCDDTRVMLAAFSPADDASSPRTVNIGAAGTSMRFLTAYFASQEGMDVLLTGSERMKQRPIALLVDALRRLGAYIEYAEAEGFPPLRIHGRQLDGGDLTIDGSISSQYISALLMVAPTLRHGLTLHLEGRVTSVPYIEMTLGMMQQWGVEASWDAEAATIAIAPQSYRPQAYAVESDWSASSYWYEMMLLYCQDDVELKGLETPSLQGDSAMATIYRQLSQHPECLDLDMAAVPDLAQTVVCTCCALGVRFSLSGLHTLRIKETDRIAALENELQKLGFAVTHRDTSTTIVMEWDGTRCPAAADPVIATYKDHRMAMAFAPLAVIRPGRTLTIDDPQVVSKSYPHYWEDLRAAGFLITQTD